MTAGIYWGAWMDDEFYESPYGGSRLVVPYSSPSSTPLYDDFISSSPVGACGGAGHAPSIIHWGNTDPDTFNSSMMTQVRTYGAIPMVDFAVSYSGTDQCPAITSGTYDTWITTWAEAAAAWGYPFWLRWGHEMNGNWFPWGTSNTPAAYVAAFQHIHGLFQSAGATNASFIWCPNDGSSNATYNSYYPGDAYVDWIGMDSYAGPDQNGDVDFDGCFSAMYANLLSLSNSASNTKPMIVCETGVDASYNQGAWFTSLGAELTAANYPRIYGFTYFDWSQYGPGVQANWPINANGEASYLAAVVAGSYWLKGTFGSLPAGKVPIPGSGGGGTEDGTGTGAYAFAATAAGLVTDVGNTATGVFSFSATASGTGTGSSGEVTLVQQVPSSGTTASGTAWTAMANWASGNEVVLVIGCPGGGAVSSVTAANGSTFTKWTGETGIDLEVWHCASVTVGSASVTVDVTGGSGTYFIWGAEVSGVASSASAASALSGTTTEEVIDWGSTGIPLGSIFISAIYAAASWSSGPSGWTVVNTGEWTQAQGKGVAYLLPTTIENMDSLIWTMGSDGAWSMVLVNLGPVVGAGNATGAAAATFTGTATGTIVSGTTYAAAAFSFSATAAGSGFFHYVGPNCPMLNVAIDFTNSPTSPTRTWTDVTECVRSLSYTLDGRTDVLATTSTGTLSMLLDNNTGNFDPLMFGGAYSGEGHLGIRRFLWVRVQGQYGATTSVRWTGLIDSWSPGWPSAGRDNVCAVTASTGLMVLNNFDLGGNDFPQEWTGARVQAVMALIPAFSVNAAAGHSICVDTGLISYGIKALSHLQQVEDTENGRLFFDASGVLQFQDRYWRINYSPTPLGTIGDQPGQIPYDPGASMALNDSQVWSQAVITPTAAPGAASSGGTAVYLNEAAAANDFQRTISKTYLTDDIFDCEDGAAWLTQIYGDPAPKLPALALQGMAAPALWPQILSMANSQRWTFVRTPSYADGFGIASDHYIEQVSEVVVPGTSWVTTVQLLPCADYGNAPNFWQLGYSEYGTLGQQTYLSY